MKRELEEILRMLENESRINEYNKLKEILEDEHVEIVDVIYKDDRVEVFCNDLIDEVPFVEIFFFLNSKGGVGGGKE